MPNMYGNDAANFLAGSQGDEELYGGAGNDALFSVFGFVSGTGTFDDPWIFFQPPVSSGNDLLEGGSGDDTIYGFDGSDVIYGGDGNDSGTVQSFNGLFYVAGLYGGNGDDIIDGGRGNDTVSGGAGNDYLLGGIGDDQVYGGTGDDVLFGGDGNDFLLGSSFDLAGVTGPDGKNLIFGERGDDRIAGGNGQDTIYGGDGADLLQGLAGKDILSGGAGVDFFIYTSVSDTSKGAGRDVITDFSHTGHDKISLVTIDANSKALGDQAFKYIGDAAFHHVRGELHEIQLANKTLVEGDTNGDGKADFQIELTGHLNLVKGDFIL